MNSAAIFEISKIARLETSHYGILNIFYYLKAKYSRVLLTYSGFIYTANVTEVEHDYILFSAPNFQETQDRRAILQFEAFNRYYSANLQILRTNENGIFIQFPQEIRFLARRKKIRLKFDDLFMRFIILYSPILGSRQEEKILENKYPHFMLEILKEDPSIRTIFHMVVEEAQRITGDYSIQTLYDKEPENYSLAENIMLGNGKSLLIEDVSRISTYTERMETETVGNYSQYYESLTKENGEYEAMKILEESRKDDSRNFLVSYLMSPITMFGSIIGYLRLETNQFDKKWIMPSLAEEIHRVMELFSYAISKTRIRKSLFDPSSVETRVVNLSLSGMLIELTDDVIYRYLHHHKRIKILMPIMGEELELYGEIVRYYELNNLYYMGVMFFKSRPGDMIKLEQFIHENLRYQFG